MGPYVSHYADQTPRIPNVADYEDLAQHTTRYSYMATSTWPEAAALEAHAMEKLTLADCRSVPEGYYNSVHHQDASGWVPGGLIVAMCMQKLPGEDLSRVYDEYALPKSERVRIRTAFKVALL